MESGQQPEWKAVSQEAGRTEDADEQPGEHGLCWRQTEFGILAFKINEDGSKTWIRFDNDGNGTEVVFDEAGQAYYVDGETTIPVAPLDPSLHGPEHDSLERSTAEAAEAPVTVSQETFGRGAAASQVEMLTQKDKWLNSDSHLQMTAAGQNLYQDSPTECSDENGTTNPGAENEDENTQHHSSKPGTAAIQPRSTVDCLKTPVCGSSPLALLSTASEELTTQIGKKRAISVVLSGVQSPAGASGDLLSLWGEAKSAKPTEEGGLTTAQQTLLRLQQLGVPERLERIVEEEKTLAEAPTSVLGSCQDALCPSAESLSPHTVLEENVQARRDESGSEPLRLAYFSVPEHNISEPSAEEEPIEDSNLLKDRTQKAQQPTPTASSSLCWNLCHCGAISQTDVGTEEAPPPLPSEQATSAETAEAKAPAEAEATKSDEDLNIITATSPPAPVETASRSFEQQQQPASVSAPQKSEAYVRPVETYQAKDKEKGERPAQVVYIDHYPEPFVKSYFGDDGTVEMPSDWRDIRFNTATDILYAAGTAMSVVAAGGAVVLGTAALTAGLTVGIAALEIYKRVANNYDI
ncbi:hypothetical protein, conserved [Eimeria necatrix]|uniref:Uncharacterized protein n=1 Tax=Eimeria necatrix TaxID=51315 RepID=U6MJ27_9EIME|nr:hypothetical protein, conserved [Eimeria necatrix]CDJ63058.1 hypothetical protein, conserved [Eimeria necatrix]